MGTSTEDLSARAKQLIAERRYQEAVRACRRILLSRPAMTEVRVLLGMALLALSRHDEVRAEMMAVLRASPEAGAAHRLLGEAHLRDGQVDKARESFRRALELDPSDQEAQELLSEVAAEEPVISATIDRWFDPEAVATTQTESPDWDEDVTGSLPAALPDVVLGTTDLEGEATIAQAPFVAPPPGAGVDREPPPRAGRPRTVPPPPPPARPRSVPPPPPPPRSSYPAPPGAPGGSHFPPPPPGGPQTPGYSVPASSIPPRAPGPAFVPDEQTAAQRPQAKVPTDPGEGRPRTDELNLSDVDEIRPPISASPYLVPAPAHAPGRPADFSEDEPTYVRPSDDDDDDGFDASAATSALAPPTDLPGERTIARPRSAPPPAFIAGSAGPPTPAEFAAPPLAAPAPAPAPRLRSAPPPAFAPGGPADFSAPPHASADPGGYPRSPVPNAGGAYPAHPAGAYPAQPGAASPATGDSSPAAFAPARPPGTPKKGSRALLFGIGVLVPLFIGIVGFAVVSYWLDSRAQDRITAALVACEEDGRRASLDQAIALAEEYDGSDATDFALRARLQATLVLEHGETDSLASTQALLDELEGDELHHADAIIASAYIALARGNINEARGIISQLPIETGPNAELERARARVAAANEDHEMALDAARVALAQRPNSPRHAALSALIEAQAGDIQKALETLANVPDGNASGDVRVGRGRILKLANSDPNGALAEAVAVLDQLATTATGPQRAWSHLIKAWHASVHGAPATVVEEGRAALEARPLGDEEFALDLAEIFIDGSAFDEAEQTLGNLPEVVVRAERRSRLLAAVSLGRGDVEGAAAALTAAGSGPAANLMRGRVAEAQGQLDDAVAFYRRAREADPALNVAASTRLGAIAAGRREYADAVGLLRPVAEQAPSNVVVVGMLVDALVALDRMAEAERIVDQAIRAPRPDDVAVPVPILVARARLEGARGDWPAAAETLRDLSIRAPDAVDVHRSLGEAALRAEIPDVAEVAFGRVLELAANDGPALAGLALLAVSEGTDVAAMEAAITRAREAGGTGPFLAQAEARLMVWQGKGWEAVRPLRRLARESADAGLQIALGRALSQASRDSDAARVFDRVITADPENLEALLGLAAARARSRSTEAAEELLGRVQTIAEAQRMPPSFMARVGAARASVAYARDDFAEAQRLATEAVTLDAGCGEAQFYVGASSLDLGADGPALQALRRAVATSPPSVEAMGLLVAALGSRLSREERCTLGARYLAAAPRGFDARDVRRLVRSCR